VVIAVSKIAVDFATETLAQTGFHFRSDLQYFAVGQQTAAYFSAKIEQTVKYPIDQKPQKHYPKPKGREQRWR